MEHLEEEHGMCEEESSLAYRAALEFDVATTRSGIKIPPAEAPPIPGLQVRLGYMCTAETGCPCLSPYMNSLNIHFSKHGDRRHSAHYQKVALQDLFPGPGRRPFYFVVNTSATPGESAAGVGKKIIAGTSQDVDIEDGLIEGENSAAHSQKYADGSTARVRKELRFNVEPASPTLPAPYSALTRSLDALNSLSTSQPTLVSNDNASIYSQEYADGRNSSRARLRRGLRANLEPATSTLPAPYSALTSSLPALNSQSIPQPVLASEVTLLLSPNTMFLTKRQDTGKVHICLASDITSPGLQGAVLGPSSVHFESYCELLRSEQILDEEGEMRLGFQPTGGERVPILNKMMFRAAITYQVDRKFDIVSFSAAVSALT